MRGRESLFVYLSKFLPTLVYPAGITFISLILALALFNRPKWRKGLLWFALAVLFISGTPFLSGFLNRSLEDNYAPFDGSKKAQVIVVMGGGTDSKEYPRQMVEVSGAGDRILYSAQLLKDGYGEKLLFGGTYYEVLSGEKRSIARDMADVAVMVGVPQDAILLQEKSLNSYEEAVEDAAVLKTLDVTEIILVTSATHMTRAVGLFEKQGLQVIPAPTDFGYSDQDWKNFTSLDWKKWYTYLIPQSSNMSSLETALKEYIGIAVYRLRGWMD
jgi:uncharacterized SAM-binding protein YcdF (DUF218 family)